MENCYFAPWYRKLSFAWADPEGVHRVRTPTPPLKNHKATKAAFNVGPSLARQQNAIKMVFRWRTDDGPFIVVFGSSLPSSTKKPVKVGPPLSILSGSAHELYWVYTHLGLVYEPSIFKFLTGLVSHLWSCYVSDMILSIFRWFRNESWKEIRGFYMCDALFVDFEFKYYQIWKENLPSNIKQNKTAICLAPKQNDLVDLIT